jgi:DNA gyrase subunit A
MPTNNQNKPKIILQSITEEMRRSYLDYAMSVIVARALPDVRDGLKPVHRRILYAMYRLGLTSDAKSRKSAMVVGEVLGKYHPHGDIPVYDALSRMAQDFSMRYPLIRGQGNFGSIDGDPPAAMRYTEAKLEKISAQFLEEIDKDTVAWRPNYDNSRQEPTVLPAKLPNLLLNGSMGIAVGMATNIPPHNLGEIVDATIAVIDSPKITPQELSQIVPGPDFPTGGKIYDVKAMTEAYAQGRGSFICRANADIEPLPKEKGYRIIVKDLVWQVNKASLVESIANLVKTKKILGIKTIRDESNREGIRIVIEIKKNFQPQKILNKLYKFTDLQKTYHLNLLALVDGIQPQVLSLKEVLELFVQYRLSVVKKRIEFDLKQAKARAHLLEGFSKAIKNIEEVIAVIKASKSKENAKNNLIKKFAFSVLQAEAILKMRLQTLAGLERKKIEDELKEKRLLIRSLEELLASPKKIKGLLKKELLELKAKYGDARRTQIIPHALKAMADEELIQQKDVSIAITKNGYIKRSSLENYKQQHRAGVGISLMVPKEEDWVKDFFIASTLDTLLFFTNQGKVYSLKAYEIPEGSRLSKGKPIINLIDLGGNEEITAVLVLPKQLEQDKDLYIVMATQHGIIKKTPIKLFSNIRRSGIKAIKLNRNDILEWAAITGDQSEILLVSRLGQAIRFWGKEIRPMGRNAAGVRGIRLREEDIVKTMGIINAAERKSSLLLIGEKGLGKKTAIAKFRRQKRGGYGIRAIKITTRTGDLAGGRILKPEEESLMIISKQGKVIRVSLGNIPLLNRNAQGVKIMRLKPGDSIADFITF